MTEKFNLHKYIENQEEKKLEEADAVVKSALASLKHKFNDENIQKNFYEEIKDPPSLKLGEEKKLLDRPKDLEVMYSDTKTSEEEIRIILKEISGIDVRIANELNETWHQKKIQHTNLEKAYSKALTRNASGSSGELSTLRDNLLAAKKEKEELEEKIKTFFENHTRREELN
jgi:hypothetical protein